MKLGGGPSVRRIILRTPALLPLSRLSERVSHEAAAALDDDHLVEPRSRIRRAFLHPPPDEDPRKMSSFAPVNPKVRRAWRSVCISRAHDSRSLAHPQPFLQQLTGKQVIVKLKWGGLSYKGFLVSTDSEFGEPCAMPSEILISPLLSPDYMNFQVSIQRDSRLTRCS